MDHETCLILVIITVSGTGIRLFNCSWRKIKIRLETVYFSSLFVKVMIHPNGQASYIFRCTTRFNGPNTLQVLASANYVEMAARVAFAHPSRQRHRVLSDLGSRCARAQQSNLAAFQRHFPLTFLTFSDATKI
ncbi:hypothetical protein M378DRAFT_160305 [Amanita muscaria Koide BX008]|uniref:Uncharacterized protein n=1 Tax=Amanita muscaria (strain Koide BX008) TaxID=946122 RepID=A0A0C2XBR4_AMAMK|nr:hypothetical protein M378DRAFT_160305 [Amanita muscaria Koide BX008]